MIVQLMVPRSLQASAIAAIQIPTLMLILWPIALISVQKIFQNQHPQAFVAATMQKRTAILILW
jgi:hypothetical protein